MTKYRRKTLTHFHKFDTKRTFWLLAFANNVSSNYRDYMYLMGNSCINKATEVLITVCKPNSEINIQVETEFEHRDVRSIYWIILNEPTGLITEQFCRKCVQFYIKPVPSIQLLPCLSIASQCGIQRFLGLLFQK